MTQVKPIPDGMHTITPHLVCAGAADAIAFYKNAFSAKELIRINGANDKIVHACIQIGDSKVMLVDEFPEWGSFSPKSLKGASVTIHLYVENVDGVFAQAINSGVKVKMPLENTFWGDRYGVVEDPFGHLWSIATHIRDISPEEVQAASDKMFAK